MSNQTPTPDYEAAGRYMESVDGLPENAAMWHDFAREVVDAALEGLVVVSADEPLYRKVHRTKAKAYPKPHPDAEWIVGYWLVPVYPKETA